MLGIFSIKVDARYFFFKIKVLKKLYQEFHQSGEGDLFNLFSYSSAKTHVLREAILLSTQNKSNV